MSRKAGGSTTPPKAGASLKTDKKSALIAVATNGAPRHPKPQLATSLNKAISILNERLRIKLQPLQGPSRWQSFPVMTLFDLTEEGYEANSEVMRELATASAFLHDLHAELTSNYDFEADLDVFLKSESREELITFLDRAQERLAEEKFNVGGFLKTALQV